jgi:hypothetical protein
MQDTNRPRVAWRLVGAVALPFVVLGIVGTLAETRHLRLPTAPAARMMVGYGGVLLGAVLLATLPIRWWLRGILVIVYIPVACFLALYFGLMIACGFFHDCL